VPIVGASSTRNYSLAGTDLVLAEKDAVGKFATDPRWLHLSLTPIIAASGSQLIRSYSAIRSQQKYEILH
jgi:hypothetical protein